MGWVMKNKVTVTVAGNDYTLLSDEAEDYVRAVAASVGNEITQIMTSAHLSLSHASVLAALNTADKARKAAESADHLREQVKTYLDETQKLKSELAEARRELSRLKKQI